MQRDREREYNFVFFSVVYLDVESNDAAEAVHLFLRQFMLRVRRQTRIKHLLHLCHTHVNREKERNSVRVRMHVQVPVPTPVTSSGIP